MRRSTLDFCLGGQRSLAKGTSSCSSFSSSSSSSSSPSSSSLLLPFNDPIVYAVIHPSEVMFLPQQTTWWSSTRSSKVNLHHAINFRSICGANVVTYSPKFWGNATLELHRVDIYNTPCPRDGILTRGLHGSGEEGDEAGGRFPPGFSI